MKASRLAPLKSTPELTSLSSPNSLITKQPSRNLTPIIFLPGSDSQTLSSSISAPALESKVPKLKRQESWLAHLHGATPPPVETTAPDQVSLLAMLRSIWMSSDSVENTIDKAVKMAYKFVHAERITMFLVDSSTDELVLSTSKDARGLRMPLTAGLAGHVASTGEVLCISDPYSDKRFNQSMDTKTGFRTRNLIVIPIMDAENCVVAVLQGVNRIDDNGNAVSTGFTLKDIDILRAMSDSIGVVIKKSQMHQVIVKEKRNIQALFDLMKAVHADEGIIDLRTLTDVILNTAKTLLQADRVELYLISPLRDELYMAPGSEDRSNSSNSSSTENGNLFKSHRIPMGSGIPGRVAAQGGAAVVTRLRAVADDQTALLISELPLDCHSAICMPVTTRAHGATDHVNPNDIEAVIFATRTKASYIDNKRSFVDDNDTKSNDETSSIDSPTKLGRKLARPFTSEDCKALQAFCFECARALKMHAVETAFASLLSQKTNDPSQSVLDLSFLALYTSETSVKGYEASKNISRRTSIMANPSIAKERATDLQRPHGDSKIAEPPSPSNNQNAIPFDATSRSRLFDPLIKSTEELVSYVVPLMETDFGILKHFEVNKASMFSFISDIQDAYATNNNPFHNFYHGFDVFHTTYLFLKQNETETKGIEYSGGGAALSLDKLSIFSVLIAALCHDVAHTGRNNQFEINSESPLALLHNDDAVLERHHCHTTMSILNKEANVVILTNFSKEEKRQFRKIVLTSILATDMATHFKLVEDCEKRLLDETRRVFDPTNKDDLMFLCKSIVHCSDLGGQTSPWKLANKWGDLVIQEFQSQSEQEKLLGLPESPFMLGLEDELLRNRLQTGFITYVLLPLWDGMCQFFPGMNMHLVTLKENRTGYTEIIDRITQERKEQEEKEAAKEK